MYALYAFTLKSAPTLTLGSQLIPSLLPSRYPPHRLSLSLPRQLREAIKKILKRSPTDAEAEEIIRLLDTDGDGTISKEELFAFVENKRMMQETAILGKSLAATKDN